MQSKLAKYICDSLSKPSLKIMPFFHNVDSLKIRDIIETGALKTKKCPVFNEPLVYLFYGRPAYKLTNENGNWSDEFHTPISFILSSNSSINIKRIYPFDTGAFTAGFYENHVPKEFSIDNFLLGTSHEVPRMLIEIFFENNENYFLGKPTFSEHPKFLEYEVKAFLNIIKAKGQSPFDDRAYTIEYQLASDMEIKGNILAVVAPSEAFDDPLVYDKVVGEWNAIPLNYSTYHCGDLRTYHGAMFEKIKNFLKKKDYL